MANKLIKFPDSSLSPVVFYINGIPHVYDNSGMLVRIDTQPTNVKTLALKFRGNYNLSVYGYPEGMTIDELKRDLFVGSVILDDKGKLFHTTSVNSRLQLGENIIAMTLPYSTKYDSDNLAGYPYLVNATFVVLDKDNQVYTYQGGHFIKPPKEEGDVRKLTFDKKVVDSYSLGNRLFTILKTDDNELYMWQPLHKGRKSQYKDILYKIPGKEIKNISHSILYDESVPIYYTDAFLTDEGLFLFHGSRYGVSSRKIDFPKTVHPDNIKAIETFTIHNIFLLTNDGRVYATGENDYYQRGSKKKLDTDSWNEIKYPEKIKQLGISYQKPGLFALSESGNLYYHGYNEDSYYPITGRKSNISKPMKILEGIKSIWTPRFDYFSIQDPVHSTLWVYPVWLFDSTGDFFMLPVKPLVDNDYKSFLIKSPSKACPADVYKMVSNDIIYTPYMIHATLQSNC